MSLTRQWEYLELRHRAAQAGYEPYMRAITPCWYVGDLEWGNDPDECWRHLIDALQALGSLGWELVCVQTVPIAVSYNQIAYLKRPKA